MTQACLPPVHPHARGEDVRTRLRERRYCWFTPTHVGKTSCGKRSRRLQTVHPHARGEDVVSAHLVDVEGGSPPRTWGRRPKDPKMSELWRFTPTHVGKTSDRLLFRWLSVVHPHARGEDAHPKSASVPAGGSPPRTWGRRLYQQPRFTTLLVHPHARGEDTSRFHNCLCKHGSPPRTWGRPRNSKRSTVRSWFTPTHVGKTPS